MSTAADSLLIIVSSVLVIFLLAATAVAYYFITVMRDIKRITEKADHAAGIIESIAATAQKTATPLAIFKVAKAVFKKAKNKE